MTDTPTAGHNQPPTDAEILSANLTEKHKELIARRDQLLGAEDRLPEITNAETEDKVATFVKMLTAFENTCDLERKEAKDPYLNGGRIVDAFFKATLVANVTALKGRCMKLVTAYKTKVAEEERKRRAEIARQEREAADKERREAEAKAKEAEKAGNVTAQVEAKAQETQAVARSEAAERLAETNVPSVTRGAVATSALRYKWVCKEFNRATVDLEALRHHLKADHIEAAIRAHIKAGNHTLGGATIVEEPVASVR